MIGIVISRLGLIRFVFALAALGVWTLSALAAPQLQPLNGQSLQRGNVTTLLLEGADLLPAPRLLLPFPVTIRTIKPGATASRLELEIETPPTVPIGTYLLRLGNSKGISNAVAVSVDDLPPGPISAQLAKLPASVHGVLSGSTTTKTSFLGKKGERFVADVECRRIGSTVDPVVELISPQQRLVALAQGQKKLNGDARLDVLLPEDGAYSLELHDALYQAAGHFRLKVGDVGYAEAILPLGVQRGQAAKVQLLGPGLGEATLAIPPADMQTDFVPIVTPGHRLIGPIPRLAVSEFPEVAEVAMPAGKSQDVPVPAAISGRIAVAGEEDKYRLLVQPGQALRFDVFAERVGSALDGVLTLRQENGAQVAFSDDRADTVDPGFEYTVPAGVKALVLSIADSQGRGGPDLFYRIAVTPANLPTFALSLSEDRLTVPARGNAMLRIRANRQGYNGPIPIRIAGLPPGATLQNDTIPAGADTALVIVKGPEQANVPALLTSVHGLDPGTKATHAALAPETPVTRGQPWLRHEIGLAVAEPLPMAIAWAGPAVHLPLGAGLPVAVNLTRAPSAKGQVRISLVTTQVVPKGQDGKDDINRAIRLEGAPMIAADQATGTAKILVPANLSRQPYDLALRAELLGPNGTVLATAVSDVRRMEPGPAFAIEFVGKPDMELKPGAATKLAVKVLRYGDFTKPVTLKMDFVDGEIPLSLNFGQGSVNAPTGFKGGAVTATVTPDQMSYELSITIGAAAKPGAVGKIKVSAVADGATPGSLRSNELAITLKVPGAEPAPKK